MDRRTALKVGVVGLAGMAAGTGAQAGASVPTGGNAVPDDSELRWANHAMPVHGEPLGYVPDDPDYLVDGYIAGVPRHLTRCEVESMRRAVADEPPKESLQYFVPPLRFRYRPMTAEENHGFERPSDCVVITLNATIYARMLAERIKAWDLKGPDGKVLPISEATMLRLRPELFKRLEGIVVYYDQTSDPMPG